MDINTKIAEELGIRREQAAAAVKLIDEGCTIPFIARYRKEATGALSDEILRNLYDRLVYLRNLEDKKQTVLASIEEQGKLTEELRAQILAAETQVAVDDLYRPYRPKRRTRATIAKEKGLEPLANMILLQKICQCVHIDRFQIIHRIQHRISAVHFYKVGKALAEDAIVDDQHPIVRLGETGAGRFQAKDALTAQNQRLVLCAKQGADELAGLLIERIKVRIQIRIGTGQASGCQHIFPDLCRPGCHNFVHGKLSFLN